MSLHQSRYEGKHLPASHPLVRAMRDSRVTELPRSVQASEEVTARLDAIAIQLHEIGGQRLSIAQRRMAETLGRELLRQARA